MADDSRIDSFLQHQPLVMHDRLMARANRGAHSFRAKTGWFWGIAGETWRHVPGLHPSIEVSDLGRVRSTEHRRVRREEPVLRKATSDRCGYQSVKVRLEGGILKCRFVHSLVLEAFVGPRPEGMGTRHLDGKPRNNRLSNLAWGTPLENSADQIDHAVAQGRFAVGSPISFTAEQTNQIRAFRGVGTEMFFARQFGVTRKAIERIWSISPAHLQEARLG